MVNIAQKIYLDFNATTPIEPEVIANVTDTLQNEWANPSSSSDLGKRAKLVVDGSRTQIARMLNCSPSDVIFTSGGTEVCIAKLQSLTWMQCKKESIHSVIFRQTIWYCGVHWNTIMNGVKIRQKPRNHTL